MSFPLFFFLLQTIPLMDRRNFFCFVLLIRVFDSEWLEQKDQVEITQSQAPFSEPDIFYEAC